MNRTILHVDFDSFFASCEQQFNPHLRNKPIGVTAEHGRTCIIAASREAKRYGIKTGSRTFEAKRLCPDLIFVPARFEKYWEVSKKFISICKDYSPYTEVFSLDEVFMDVTSTVHLFGGVYAIVDKIRKRLAQEVGEYITVSVGISHNKMLAKLASGLNKPNGLVEINKENVDKVYKIAKLTDICGIGERIKIRLNSLGIYNLLDLRKSSLAILIQEFGKAEGEFLKNIGLGIDDLPIIPYTEAQTIKSVGRNYCLPQNEYDEKIVLQNLYELCEEIGIKLRRLGKKARTVGFSLIGNVVINGRKTHTDYFDTGSEIFHRCMRLAHSWNKGSYVRQISIWVSNLEDTTSLQLALFEDVSKKDRLRKTIDAINKRFGDHTIRNGFLLYADKLTTKPNGYMADKYEREVLRYAF